MTSNELRFSSSPACGGSPGPAAKTAYDHKRAFARGAGDGGELRRKTPPPSSRTNVRSDTSPVNGGGEEKPYVRSVS